MLKLKNTFLVSFFFLSFLFLLLLLLTKSERTNDMHRSRRAELATSSGWWDFELCFVIIVVVVGYGWATIVEMSARTWCIIRRKENAKNTNEYKHSLALSPISFYFYFFFFLSFHSHSHLISSSPNASIGSVCRPNKSLFCFFSYSQMKPQLLSLLFFY